VKSLDVETDGVDFSHGTKPFFITICDEDLNLTYFEWNVNPLTRNPDVPDDDLRELREIINSESQWVGQNFRFDVKALESIGVFNELCIWDWSNVNDTLIAGHLLASNAPHDLTSMALMELGVNIKPYEEALREAVNEARRYVRSHYPKWKIAKRGLEGMPSAKEAVWQYDMWLPRAVALEEGYPESHPWWTVLAEYSNADSSVTLPLMMRQMQKIEARGLDKIYRERLKLLPIAHQMEKQGITANSDRAVELKCLYTKSATKLQNLCINLSEGKLEDLPVNGASNALRDVVFNHFGLVASKSTPKGEPSLNKFVLDEWINTLERNKKSYLFVKSLRDYRKRKTALSFIDSYETYWLEAFGEESPWKRMYPSLNMTGTHTLRWSSQNPNETQISKQELEEENEAGILEKRSARYMFGPLPGEEWWSLDAQNIERRIPAYEANEEEIIKLFERPDDPPYYGSEHSLVAHLLWKKEFEACGNGKAFKDKYKSTLYQWTKNFNFACQYSCQEKKGDETAHQKGAYQLVKHRFNKQTALNDYWVNFANKNGYVETIPDRDVDPTKGYPLQVERTQWGRVSPTTPFSFHIQGTAMQWTNKAMVRVADFLAELNRSDKLFRQFTSRNKTTAEWRVGYKMIIQQHDEIVYSFPQGIGNEKWKTNLPIVRELQRIMSLGGNDIGIPTPVAAAYHELNWGEEIVL
jgi:DNA polymerase I-like protein with 3'-5' exonuclease and polymerase domains